MAEFNNDELILTQEGYDKIVAEREELVSVKRAEVADRLKEAISYGDLSENAEYDAAKNEQAELEARIDKLDQMLKKARIISEEDLKGDVVSVGLTITVKDLDLGEEEVYTIVGATESDPFNGKISNESAVGKSLLGHKKGDKVDVEVPDGFIRYEILNIAR